MATDSTASSPGAAQVTRRLTLSAARSGPSVAAVVAAVLASALVTVPAGGAFAETARPVGGAAQSSARRVVHISLVGKVDATSGKPGTFTGREGWPAMAPSNLRVPAGATVVLDVKEYDDMATPLHTMMMMGSPFNRVIGGTERVDGKPVTSVANADISHTFTIPQLGINVPLPKAPHGGVVTVVFRFRAPTTPGTYTWQCETPCGSGPMGMWGAMATYGWMRGHFAVG